MSNNPEYNRRWYLANKKRLAADKAWRQKHDLDYRLRAVLRTIIQRCTDPRHATYRYYGGKGIKNFLTLNDLKTLWVRDHANKMKKPSIDRRESHLDYTFENCFFNELLKNQQRAWKKKDERIAAIRDGMAQARAMREAV